MTMNPPPYLPSDPAGAAANPPMAYQQPVPSQYPPQGWQPKVPRPPLTPRHKSGARWAGIVGFNMMALGWFLFIVPLSLALFVGFFTFLIGEIGKSSSAASDNSFAELSSFFDTFNVSAWIIPALLIALVGAVLWAGGILTSGRILKSRAVNHPWGVTWAAAGIAILAYPFVTGAFGLMVRVISGGISTAANADWWWIIAVGGAISFFTGIVLNCVIGWLAWWWMAYAMRSAQPPAA